MRPLCSDSGYPAVWNFGLNTYSSSLTLKKFADLPAGRVQSLPFCWSVTGEAQSPTDSEPTTAAENQLALR